MQHKPGKRAPENTITLSFYVVAGSDGLFFLTTSLRVFFGLPLHNPCIFSPNHSHLYWFMPSGLGKNGGWWRWALVSPDGVAPSRMVGTSAAVNLPLHHKVQKFSSGTSSPRWSWKQGHKTVVWLFMPSTDGTINSNNSITITHGPQNQKPQLSWRCQPSLGGSTGRCGWIVHVSF